MSTITEDFLNALLSGNKLQVREIYENSSHFMNLDSFVEDVLVVSLEEMGIAWENGTIALSQIYMSGKICEELIDEILPQGSTSRKNEPKMAICVLNDYHLLGKRIVYSLLRANGYELVDYGRIEVEQLVKRIKQDNIEILLLSVLMLPSALQIKEFKKRCQEENIDVRIVVGGAPFRFDTQLWKEVGADAMGRNASDALSLITSVSGG